MTTGTFLWTGVEFPGLNGLIVRVPSYHRQLLAGAVDLRAGHVVYAVGHLGELGRDGHSILRVVEVARDPYTLNCLALLVEHKSYRIVGLDVVLNDEGRRSFSSAQLHRDISLRVGLLQPIGVWLGILPRQVSDLRAVVLKFRLFLGHDVAF